MRIAFLILSFVAALQVHAQEGQPSPLFKHVDVGLTAGSLGIGLEVATPLTRFMDVRTGFTYMPHFEVQMDFPISVYDNNRKPSSSRFERMAGLMKEVSGFEVDDQVDMIGTPRFNNFKFLLDFKPFRNKNWSITAGFYLGSRNIAKAYNTTEDMPSLFAVSLFNHIRDVYISGGTIYGETLSPELGERLRNFGEIGIHVGAYTHDVPYPTDVYNTEWIPDPEGVKEEGYEAGEYLMHRANDPNDPMYKAGDPYLMQPDESSMVKARIRVNAFRPYLGFGYGGRLLKNDDRYLVHLECGALFWGGTPHIITHDGTDLSTDVTDIDGKVGRYVDFFTAFKVYPVLHLRLTRRF